MVSVVIPSYNAAHLVLQAIGSVLHQPYADVEVIVVDDGSTDNTREQVQALAAKDARVVYVYQENRGLGPARNTGIAHARGEYIAFLDADDLFLPNKIALQVAALERDSELGLVAGGHRFMDMGSGLALAERYPWQHAPKLDLATWLMGCPIVVCAALVRTEWVRRVGGFAVLRRAEDRDLWLRLSYAGCQMAWTPEVVCVYRMHTNQMTRDGNAQKEITLQVLENFFARAGLPAGVTSARDASFANAYLSGAFREYGANQVIEAQHSLACAVALAPHIITRPVNAGNIDDSECLPPLVYTLISWAREPFNGDPTAFVQRVLDHLPPTAAQAIAPSVQAREHILSTAAVWAALDAICVDNPALARQHLSNAIKRLPKLRNQPDLAIALMIDYLKAFPSELQLTYAQRFFDALPSMNALRNKALARLHMARAFHEHTSGAVKESANAAKKGLQLDRSWLRNRGVLSILWQGWRA